MHKVGYHLDIITQKHNTIKGGRTVTLLINDKSVRIEDYT